MHLSFDKSDGSIEAFYNSVSGRVAENASIFYGKRQIDIFLLAMAIGVEQKNRERVKSLQIAYAETHSQKRRYG